MKEITTLFPNSIKKNIVSSWVTPIKEAVHGPVPDFVSNKTQEVIKSLGIEKLYRHQSQSINYTYSGGNVAVVTGTGSGKSLCYQIPLIDSYLINPENTSLLLFPTKALSADQFSKFLQLSNVSNKIFPDKIHPLSIGIYDGDTPKSQRKLIREKTNLLITNPDMLHIGILPHHTSWARYLSNLKFIVIDEMHVYKGVFGSHFANLLRRLDRILDFYGSSPQFILTSATIGNPKILAESIIEKEVFLIENDFSKQNQKQFIFYNPPIINPRLGLRKGMLEETYRISNILRLEKIQTIVFGRSRNSVEKLLIKFNQDNSANNNTVSAYRSGFLKSERRKIEAGLRSKEIELIVSTTALELGIDIGSVEAIILMGYPGSLAKFFQQAGRAGRNNNDSICMMIASASPLDQFFIRHPEFIKGKSPEHVRIDPNNQFLLFNHLKCAAFELPFKENEHFGSVDWCQTRTYLEILRDIGLLHERDKKFFWISDQYPAKQTSLRSISGNPIILKINKNNKISQIGEVDQKSAKKIIFPGSIYLHNGRTFQVNSLDLNTHVADLSPIKEVYFTEPEIRVKTKIEKLLLSIDFGPYKKEYGEVKIEETVIGFNKFSWGTRELLGQQSLDLEPDYLSTKGLWISFTIDIVSKLRALNLWTNDKNEYGLNWESIREKIMKRDEYKCQNCGKPSSKHILNVHHIKPFRSFIPQSNANQPNNLISLCKNCHRLVENNIRTRSLLNGLTYGISHIAPFYLNCDIHDLGYSYDENIFDYQNPGIIIYDQFPGGIGLSKGLFSKTEILLGALKDLAENCLCNDGCPSCVGPPGENGVGAKPGVIELLKAIIENNK
jgi:DEAD/DEAH box helicase domain-containing protein